MMSLLGFNIGFWDYLTFLTLFLFVIVLIFAWIWMAGIPGRIALSRKHPEAEAVKMLGYAGLLPTIYPWVQAFIWAFKPTDIIDIRRFPKAEKEFIEEETARLRDEPKPGATPSTDPSVTSAQQQPEKALPSSDGDKQ